MENISPIILMTSYWRKFRSAFKLWITKNKRTYFYKYTLSSQIF